MYIPKIHQVIYIYEFIITIPLYSQTQLYPYPHTQLSQYLYTQLTLYLLIHTPIKYDIPTYSVIPRRPSNYIQPHNHIPIQFYIRLLMYTHSNISTTSYILIHTQQPKCPLYPVTSSIIYLAIHTYTYAH